VTTNRSFDAWLSLRKAIINNEAVLSIPVHATTGAVIGVMSAISQATVADNHLVEAFTRWRAHYRHFFLTQFTPTPDRTRNWLRTILDDDRRMLFTIYVEQRPVGHYGFKTLTTEDAELDNLLRGERGGPPALMGRTVFTLSRWLFDTIGIRTVVGHILADNHLALKLHTTLGFTLGDTFPLTLSSRDEEARWTIGPAGMPSRDSRYYQQVILRSTQRPSK